jgi:YesN/AraC family two-component response regulator
VIRLLLLDDHQMMIDGLRSMLDTEPQVQVMATAQRPQEATEALQQHPIDLAIIDMNLREATGHELIPGFRQLVPGLKILVLSMYDDKRMIRAALQAGADGYLLKGSGKAELMRAILRIMDDDVSYSGEVASKLLEDFVYPPAADAMLQASDLDRLRGQEKPEERSIRMSEEEAAEIYSRLMDYVTREKPYLDRDLTLPKLAERLHLAPYKLSYIVNLKENKHFFHFINAFRVQEAQQLLASSMAESYTLEGIGYEAGFNNKVTFISSFKKECGLTPGQYRKQIQLGVS